MSSGVRVRVGAAALVAGCAAALAGCGSDTAASDASGPAVSATPGVGSGPFFGECGSVSDAEVAEAFGVPGFDDVVRNSVGCEWQLSAVAGQAAPHVSFSWYRGSPIGRERAGSELIGRPATDIDIGGHPGFVADFSDRLCELGVEFGNDFVHWSIAYGDGTPTADPCEAARTLAELTAARAVQ